MNKGKPEKELEYIFFARSYLIMATLGNEKVLDKMMKTKRFNNPLDLKLVTPDWTWENNYLLAPIIYNIKHAIEIFLKGITRLLGSDFKEHHDLKILFKDIEKKIDKKPIIKDLERLKKLINEYYRNDFLKNKVNTDFEIEDKLNDMFRYPDNKAKILLDFFYIFPRFEIKDLERIKKNIKEFNNLFYEIGKEILIGEIGLPSSRIETEIAEYQIRQNINKNEKQKTIKN